jgi:hypothetical protein
MSLFDDYAQVSEEKGGKQLGALGKMDKAPETPDFTEWGAQPRKGSPFL